MSMRITNNMIIARNLMNQQNNLYNMNKLYEDISSTRSLHRPSDDPIRVTRALRFTADVRLNEQYQDNISYAKSWLETTDGALKEINSILHRARELAVQGANGTLGTDDKKKVSEELKQLKSHLVTVANQTLTGRRIFSGFRTDKDLLNQDGTFNMADIQMGTLANQKIELKIGDQQKFEMNITGDKVFRPVPVNPDQPYDAATNPYDYTKKPKLIRDIDRLIKNLNDGNSEEVSKSIGDMEASLKDILEVRGEVGAKVKTIEVIEDRMTDDSLNLKKLLSKTRDTDMAAAYTQFMSYEAIYRSSLAVAGRIIQPTLVDFLR
ncbi:MAG: flagellar hook-associated protein FlgL [Peptostreptococcaceae bacterium]|nr:flagellar hook-associated protein FlgL [Peptostreptococcaceae bacterium]